MIHNSTQVAARKLIAILIVSVVLVGGVKLATRIITGGAAVVNLASAPSLTGQAVQSLASNVSKSTLSGVTLKNTKYFDNGAWAVTTVVSPKNQGNNGVVVMQKVGQFYWPVIGPGTSFPSNATIGLPPDLLQYMNNSGLVYNAN